MEEIKALLARLEKVPEEVNVDAVFGKPEIAGDRIVIPIAEISYGFGMGMGSAPQGRCEEEAGADTSGSDEVEAAEKELPPGAGGGAGARARPIAYIELGPDGTHVKPIMDEQKIALAGILLGAWTVGWLGLVLKTIFARRS
jgi:uncharacterized spore protein YtfJ